MDFFGKEMLKDIGISLLIVTAISLGVMIAFYNKVSIGRVIPTVEEYALSEEQQEEINREDTDEEEEIVTTYELEASDLKKYERTKEYNKGKKNPFAVDKTGTSKKTNTNSAKSGDNSATDDEDSEGNNSSSSNFYEDDGTK